MTDKSSGMVFEASAFTLPDKTKKPKRGVCAHAETYVEEGENAIVTRCKSCGNSLDVKHKPPVLCVCPDPIEYTRIRNTGANGMGVVQKCARCSIIMKPIVYVDWDETAGEAGNGAWRAKEGG